MRKATFFVMCLVPFYLQAEFQEWTEFSGKLKPSTIPGAGVGVFTLHDIKAGTVIKFKDTEYRILQFDEIPDEFLGFVVGIDQKYCVCPLRFDHLGIDNYVNHSFEPNLTYDPLDHWVAIRDIKAGEELLEDYNRYGEPDDPDDSYFKKKE